RRASDLLVTDPIRRSSVHAIRDHRDHARDRKPDLGPRSRRVTAALPRGIGENRLPLRLAPADTPRRVAAAYADRHDAADEVAERSEEHTSELQSRESLVCR